MCKLICINKNIKIFSLLIFLSIVLYLSITNCNAQNNSTLTIEQINDYSNQSKQLVSYLEGTLNFLGNPNELPSDKDIIFNSSYLKLFKNNKVQVEDDLDENREIPLNKDIQAYLKDIEFFYKKVKFEFDIKDVNQIVTDSGVIVFKITLNRHLQGITISNDTVDNDQLRYIEVNLDPYQQDLKIASIYTTKIQEKEELRNWWNSMSPDWKNFFGKSVLVYDTLSFKNIVWFSDSTIVILKWVDSTVVDTNFISNSDTVTTNADSTFLNSSTTSVLVPDTIAVNTSIIYSLLKLFRNITTLNISNNLIFKDLTPVSELTKLTSVNISKTLISELTPIRNLNKLEELDCAGTPVTSLEALRYITTLKRIDCSNTSVNNIDVLSNLHSLHSLDLSNTNVINTGALSRLNNLVHLNLSGTNIADLQSLNRLNSITDLNLSSTGLQNLSTIDSLTSVQNLNIDSTNIMSLDPLSGYHKMSILQANSTPIADLSPLSDNKLLKIIYCDNSNVTMEEANKFMDANQQCLVIYNSQELINWWNKLNAEWQHIFRDNYYITDPVTKEKLHQLINQTKLSVAYNLNIKTLEPVSMLHRLEDINLEHTQINELKALEGLSNLEKININQTKVTTLEPLSSLHNLKIISFVGDEINNLSPLTESNRIENIYCDKSKITNREAIDFKALHPECLIVYQSEKLRLWWNNLDAEWQQTLMNKFNLAENPPDEKLQQLVDLKELSITNNLSINNLYPLNIFLRLESLTVSSTSISDISPIATLTNITKLNISSNPISDIELIYKLSKLRELNLENTSVEDLEPISNLEKLKSLNIAGTRVRSLKYLQKLTNIQNLYINNTRIKNLKHIEPLPSLKLLQCYNTSIKASKINDFRSQHPATEIIYY